MPLETELQTVARSRIKITNGLLLVVILLVPVLIKLVYYPDNTGSDDSYIHLQVARNMATGHGWGINADKPVNLSTSPLFTILIVIIDKLIPAHVMGIAQILSALFATAGLILIYLRFSSVSVGLAASAVAAISCNLWRWNGAIMEATLGFFCTSLILFLFRDWRFSVVRSLVAGFVLGLSVLVRPEFLLAIVLCLFFTLLFAPQGGRLRPVMLMTLAASVVIIPWCLFCVTTFGSILPTTFFAKSTRTIYFWNPRIIKEFGMLIAESFFWPAILTIVLLLVSRDWLRRGMRNELVLPAAWLFCLFGFYYTKTYALESIGRYLLPFLPCAVCTVGILLTPLASDAVETSVVARARRQAIFRAAVFITLGLQLATSLLINHIFIAPTLFAFNSQYRETMQQAAQFVAERTNVQDKVLVCFDIGVFSYAANGRFQIADGGGLASPELHWVRLDNQIAMAHPKFVMQSFANAPDEWKGIFGGIVQPVWHRRFQQHGLRGALSARYIFANLYLVHEG